MLPPLQFLDLVFGGSTFWLAEFLPYALEATVMLRYPGLLCLLAICNQTQGQNCINGSAGSSNNYIVAVGKIRFERRNFMISAPGPGSGSVKGDWSVSEKRKWSYQLDEAPRNLTRLQQNRIFHNIHSGAILDTTYMAFLIISTFVTIIWSL